MSYTRIEGDIGMNTDNMYKNLGISAAVLSFGESVLKALSGRFEKIDRTAEYNQLKVINAMQKCRVNADCFHYATGYGYDDIGRDTLEKVYAEVFHTDSALVRPQISCGTHALSTALSAVLRPGDEMISPAGKPYDTMEEVIGIRSSAGSLKEFGISYKEAPLLDNGTFNYESIKSIVNKNTKLALIQRSKGYQMRPSFSVNEIGELISYLKGLKSDIICMVDNCYGEFVERLEPSDVGADMTVGSLIKNPGGGLAPIGGYIAGRKELIELCGYRLIAPGLGREVGASLDTMRSFFQGFYLSPVVTSNALKAAVFAASIYERLGYKVIPGADEDRHDIIQAVSLESADALKAFCRGIQSAAPVDSYITPVPWAMPGYDCDVIMAAGAFVQGSSIELSADGPLKPPYTAFFQGGLTWPHGKLGILMSLQKLCDEGIIKI